MNHLQYITSQEAWEKINEHLFIDEPWLKQQGGGLNGNLSVSYDNVISIKRIWIDPAFDLGTKLGYSMNKWTSLVNNYIDFDYLDIIKSEVLVREKKKTATYSLSYHFSNKYQNGKDCLISMVVSRRFGLDIPMVTVNTRATEVTKRLIFDLLLVQRVVEYIFGENKAVELTLFFPMMYLQVESFTLYNNIKSIEKLIPKPQCKLHRDVFLMLHKFQFGDHEKINYDSHKRISLKLKGLFKVKPMLVKDLRLIPKPEIIYPEDCITDKQRKQFKKELANGKRI